jgi:hypothetical protein
MKLEAIIKFFDHIKNREDSHGIQYAFRFKAVLSSRKKGVLCKARYSTDEVETDDDDVGAEQRQRRNKRTTHINQSPASQPEQDSGPVEDTVPGEENSPVDENAQGPVNDNGTVPTQNQPGEGTPPAQDTVPGDENRPVDENAQGPVNDNGTVPTQNQPNPIRRSTRIKNI